MARVKINLQDDPEVPLGRELLEHLVGAHMVAHDEEELLHLVHHSIDALFATSAERSLRIMTHAAYRGQDLIVRLLDLATSQRMALTDAGIRLAGTPPRDPERFRSERLDLWSRLRDDQL